MLDLPIMKYLETVWVISKKIKGKEKLKLKSPFCFKEDQL